MQTKIDPHHFPNISQVRWERVSFNHAGGAMDGELNKNRKQKTKGQVVACQQSSIPAAYMAISVRDEVDGTIQQVEGQTGIRAGAHGTVQERVEVGRVIGAAVSRRRRHPRMTCKKTQQSTYSDNNAKNLGYIERASSIWDEWCASTSSCCDRRDCGWRHQGIGCL